jgi:PAS domain S-box-containing protein
MEWKGEFHNKKKTGELYWVKSSITPIFDTGDNISYFLAVQEDITEQKKAEDKIRLLNADLERRIELRTAQLAETNESLQKEIEERKRADEALNDSEKSYRTVIENVKEIIFQTDSNGLWIFLNKSWEEITGFSVEESLGQLFVNYVHPDDRQRNMDLFEPLINRKKEFCRHHVRYLTKSGGFRWIEVFARLGLNERNEATGTYGTLRDITEQMRAEEFENELLNLSVQLTGIPTSELDAAIDMALSQIGSFLLADRAYIFELDIIENTMSNTHEWCNIGIQPEINNLQKIPYEILPMWMASLERHDYISIPSVPDLPETWSAEREILEPQGIQSLLVIPILNENNLIGFVGLDSVVNKKEYDTSEINYLKVWSNMLASLMKNQKIELYLNQTRKNYETFFNTIDDFLFVLDTQGNIIHFNNTVSQRLGYSPEELIDNSVLMVHPSERRAEAGRIVGEMLAGTSDFCPVPLITKTGNYISVETRVKPGFWDGKPVIFGLSKDVSKIILSEEKFSKAFQSNSALMAISGFDDGIFIEVNDTFLKTLGYSREEIIGKSSIEINMFAKSETRYTVISRLKHNLPVRETEIDVKTKSGEILIGLFSADHIVIGNKLCLLTVMVDITERKQAEKEIKKARNEAEKANLAKSEFLSRMSHELRTPMNSILGFAQLMEMGELNPAHKKAVNHILNSGRHLLNLINEVLEISRIEAGKITLSLEPVKLKSVISEILDTIQPLALKHQLTIYIDNPTTDLLYVMSDSQRLKQVLLNLINNAIKYNKVGGKVIVRTEMLSKNDMSYIPVRISIIDNGLGISSEDIPKLFKPFERIGAEKTQIEGSGLGLSVVKKLIAAMGGIIGVNSTLGEGSTFWIELPMCESQQKQSQLFIESATQDMSLTDKHGTILYIEDNMSNFELVDQILKNHRSNIHLISSIFGKNAVQMAIEYAPNLILLDLDLPDIHGSQVLANLLENFKTKNIPVIIISADAMPKQMDKLLNSGAVDYLTKPLDITTFLKVIDKFFKINK